jgi:chemotaxis protein histidine kinase CheA
MDQLHQQVARARRRLILEQFLSRLVSCMIAALVVAAIAVATPRVIAIANLPERWDLMWLVGSAVCALVAALVRTFVSNRSAIDAAIEIDRRFDLRERIASSLSLSEEEQSSQAGRAVVNDALRAVGRIDVDDKFRINVGKRALWPLVPAAIVFVLVAFVNNRPAASSLEEQATAKTAENTKTALESLRKKVEEQRQKLDKEKGLDKANGLFKQIEEGTRELTQKDKVDPTKAAVKLNDLAKQLEERRQQLGGKDGLKEQFQKMKNLGAGPADKAAEAMKQGDWKKAMEEVEKLSKDLSEGKMDAATKEALEKQMAKMKEKLEAAVQAHQQAMEQLKKQIEEQKKKGDLAKAGELQKKLDQMQKQSQQQMEKLQQLAQKMGDAQQSLKKGDSQKASQSMSQMAQQLDQMQKDANEMENISMAMDQIEMAKDAMTCKFCNGEGCEHCMGSLSLNNKPNPNGKPGMGLGQGKGNGPRPEEQTATNLRDSQVKQQTRKGTATFGGFVEGPNIKGDVGQSIKEEMATLNAGPADPLTSERLPNSRREQAEQYFQMLRDGK